MGSISGGAASPVGYQSAIMVTFFNYKYDHMHERSEPLDQLKLWVSRTATRVYNYMLLLLLLLLAICRLSAAHVPRPRATR